MAEESRAATGGLFESLKTLAGSLIGIVHTRLELLSSDIAEDRAHFTTLLVLGLVALFCLGLGGLSGFFLAAGAGLAWFALHKERTRPRLFEASLAELAKDRQQIGSGS